MMRVPRPASRGAPVRVAYLCSAYPAPSHTFVLREVQALRRIGVEVETFTVRRTPAADLLSADDRVEAQRTHYLLPTGASILVGAFIGLLRTGNGARALGAAARLAWRMRRPGLRGTVWQAFYLAEAVLLWAQCSRRSIRHVHAHFANVAADVAMLTVALGTAQTPNRPWSWSFTMHGPAEFWEVGQARLSDKVESADFVVCISDFARSQLMSLTRVDMWSHLHVVHCALDVMSYGQGRDVAPAGDGPPMLLTVGRLVAVKGQMLVVEMVAALKARGVALAADIVGEGPMRADLERLIDKHGLHESVVLWGALGQEQLRTRLQAATVFVLPSFAEGVPVVLMEAMAMGVPVVTTRIAGIPELIDDGVSGLLVTPGRVDELADAVERMLTDGDLRDAVTSSAYKVVREQFDSPAEAEKLAVLFSHADPARKL
jgi:colanic acid/amylovoran biosynthesis glycosyltransferase